MNASRQQLHELIDIIEPEDINTLYRVLIKFIPEDNPTDDEIEAMQIGREQFVLGETVSHNDIDWS